MGRKEDLMNMSRKTGLPAKKVYDLLWALRSGKIENTALVGFVGVSRNVLNQIKESLGEKLTPASKNTELSDLGKDYVRELFPADYQPEESMWGFLDNRPEFNQALDFLRSITAKRPEPIRDLDQFTATEQTTARRVSLLNFFEDVTGKRILFLGDDDFTSVGMD
jgi:predicted methyltransferase